jgi:hypothetical protein
MFNQHAHRSGLVGRLIAALRLDLTLYECVSADSAATSQALRVVLLAGMCNGIGLARRFGWLGILAGVGTALLGWLLWAGVIWLTAAVFGHRRERRSLLRALGFANAPCVFLIFDVVPSFGPLIRYVVVAWLIATTVRAVQATFAVSGWRALAISTIGFVVYLALGLMSAHFAS